MSEPGPFSPPEQEEVVQNACAALVREAPVGWRQIRFEFYSTFGIDSARFGVTAQDGSEVELAPPMSAMDPLGDLRTAMYEEGTGSWCTARIVINPPGSCSIEYDHDSEHFPRARHIGQHVKQTAPNGWMYQWQPPQAVTERSREMRQSMTGPQTTGAPRVSTPSAPAGRTCSSTAPLNRGGSLRRPSRTRRSCAGRDRRTCCRTGCAPG